MGEFVAGERGGLAGGEGGAVDSGALCEGCGQHAKSGSIAQEIRDFFGLKRRRRAGERRIRGRVKWALPEGH